jgi:hypothetical protein
MFFNKSNTQFFLQKVVALLEGFQDSSICPSGLSSMEI